MPETDLKPVYYLDACVFIDLIECDEDQEPAKTIIAVLNEADKQSGRFKVVTSYLTVVEVLWAKHEADNHQIDPDVEMKINALWHPDSPVHLVEVHELIARDAQKLLRDGLKKKWKKTKGNDAIHLITAKREGATEFFTNGEQAMKKWGKLLGFDVCKPHYEPPTEVGPESKESSNNLFEMNDDGKETEASGLQARDTEGQTRGTRSEVSDEARPPEAQA
ncbi:MAG: PIN domain-containing protein [Phycisphaeraceae bacterium]